MKIQTATPVEILDTMQMAQADRLAVEHGVSGMALMEAAGRAVARAAQKMGRPCRTLVLCGPGNNGGDGYVAARLLHQMGWPVAVAALAPPRAGSDAALAAARWDGPMLPFTAEEAQRAHLVIDAVFGAGLTRNVDGLVEDVLRASRRILAVDVPSGLNGSTGQVHGYAPHAAATVTFFRLKPGHVLYPGRGLCGHVVLADIGIPAQVLAEIRPATRLNAPDSWRHLLSGPPAEAHKYTRGTVAILAGAGMPGAARLVAAAARRTGAGHVSLYAENSDSAAALRTTEAGLIVSDADMPTRADCLVIGPGLPPDATTRLRLRNAQATNARILADAGVLTSCADDPALLEGVTWITPHHGEFKRLFGAYVDKLQAVQTAARCIGAVVVLKGADTVIAAPDGRLAINAHAPATLASAGTGDVLAGIIAALGAVPWADPFDAACAAVWLHGEAGYCAGRDLVAEDLPANLPAAIMRAETSSYVFGRR